MPLQAEQAYKCDPRLLTQLQYCEDTGIPLAILIGEEEIKKKIVKLRNVMAREEVKLSAGVCLVAVI